MSSVSPGITNYSPDVRGQCYVTQLFNFRAPINHIFGMGEARHFRFGVLTDTEEY